MLLQFHTKSLRYFNFIQNLSFYYNFIHSLIKPLIDNVTNIKLIYFGDVENQNN